MYWPFWKVLCSLNAHVGYCVNMWAHELDYLHKSNITDLLLDPKKVVIRVPWPKKQSHLVVILFSWCLIIVSPMFAWDSYLLFFSFSLFSGTVIASHIFRIFMCLFYSFLMQNTVVLPERYQCMKKFSFFIFMKCEKRLGSGGRGGRL